MRHDNRADQSQENRDIIRRLRDLETTCGGVKSGGGIGSEVTFETAAVTTADNDGDIESAVVATGLTVTADATLTGVTAYVKPLQGFEYRFECWRMSSGLGLVEQVGSTSFVHSGASSTSFVTLDFPEVSWAVRAGSVYALMLVAPGVWPYSTKATFANGDLTVPDLGSIQFGHYFMFTTDNVPPSAGVVLESADASEEGARPHFSVTALVAGSADVSADAAMAAYLAAVA